MGDGRSLSSSGGGAVLGTEVNRLLSPFTSALANNGAAPRSSIFGNTPALNPTPNALAPALGLSRKTSSLFGTPPCYRRRSEWNARFAHWERSESDAETQRIERGRNMVVRALSANAWLSRNGATAIPQGSFTNRTNSRLEADIDLRVQFPLLKVEHGANMNVAIAAVRGGYHDAGVTYDKFNFDARVEILSALYTAFGQKNVEPGNKAIRVKGVTGSRGEVDVVPCFTFHRITSVGLFGDRTLNGIAILGLDQNWTINYPEQHLANGRQKRIATNLQFKKVVRTVKRLRTDMEDTGQLKKRPPSFLIECLMYIVEDNYFTWPSDDRYNRVKRVLQRASEIIGNPFLASYQTEINGIKPLFGAGQAWSLNEARQFLSAALAHLGNA